MATTIHFDLTVDNDDFIRKLREAEIGVKDASKKIEQSGMSIEQMFDRIKNAAALSLAGFSAKEFITSVAQVRGEFQQLEVAFNTMLGSKERADELMRQLVATAATTPFDLQSVSNGAKQLLAYGEDVEKVNDDLVRLGNIAAGLSQPLGDIVYLYGTTMTQGRLYTQDLNQFTGRGIPMIRELAKVFGVAENEVKGLVEAGKVGFPEVQKVIMSLTDEGGMFFNLMSEQSKTITGRISNIQDAFSTMLNDIGKANEGVIYDALEGVSSLIENYESIGRVLLGVVGTYGAYRAALMVTTALQAMQATGTAALTVAGRAHYGLLVLQTAAQKALNAAMLTNPYVLVATAVVGLGAAMWAFHDSTTESEKALERFNKRQEEARELEQERKQRIDSLVQSSRDIALSDLQRGSSLAELRKEYPKIFEQYDIESIKLADILDLKRKIADEDAKRAGEKSAKELSNVESDIKYYENLLKSLSGKKGVDGYAKKLKELRADRDVLLQEKGKGISEKFISSLNDIDISEFDRYIAELEKRIKRKGENGKIKMRLPIDIKGTLSDEAIYDVKDINTLIDTARSKKEKRIEEEKNKTTYHEDLANAKKNWEKEKKEYEALIKDQKATWEQVKVAKGELDKAEKAYKDLGGDTTGKSAKSSYKANEKRKEQEQKLSDDLLAIQRKNQQNEINLMEEGTEKKLAQIRFDYDAQKQEIEKQARELAKANKEAGITGVNTIGLTGEQQNAIDEANSLNEDSRKKREADARKQQADAEREAMNEYLKEYGDYLEKRQAITDSYNEKISKATTKGEKLSLGEQMKKELADVDDEAQKKTSIITKLFDDMSKKTVADMRLIADEAEKMLSYINSGEFKTDESGKGLFGLTKEQFDILSKSPEKLESIKNEIANVRNEADEAEPAFKKVGDGLKDIFSSGNDSVKLKKALQDIREGFDEIMKAGQFLADSLSSLGDSLGIGALSGIAEGINTAMGVMDSTMKGAEAGAMFGPIGSAAGAALGMVSSLSSAIAGIHDKKNEKRIQRLQDQIEVLDKTYEKLGNSIEKAYSNDASDLIEDQNKLLEQQKVLIQQQIREEEDKKKTDNGRIKEWREQINDINELIEENKEKAKDAIFGEDLKSAIENFADAYAEAWSSGDDKAKSAKDAVKRMIKNMISESIKAAASDPMKAIREKLLAFWSDEYISGAEQAALEKMAVDLQEQLDKQFGWAESIMGGGSYSQQASGKGFETMSQDTGNELNGRFTALQASGEEIKNQMINAVIGINSLVGISTDGNTLLSSILNQHIMANSFLEDIAKYTKPILDFGAKFDKIVEQTR